MKNRFKSRKILLLPILGLLILSASECNTSEKKIIPPPPIKTSWDDLLEDVKTLDDWENKRKILYQRFLELIGDEAKPSSKPQLKLKVHDTDTIDNTYIRKLISYNVESDQRAWAYLAIPLNIDEPAPAVVALHGTAVEGKDVTASFSERDPNHTQQAHLHHLAHRGYIVIAPDHFNMGQRLPPEGTYHTDILYKRHPGWSALGKIIYDASIAIDVLESLDKVDSNRIATLGHSLGGQSAIYLTVYDKRIRAIASSDGSFPFRFDTNIMEWARPEGQYSYFKNLRTQFQDGILPPIDIHEIMALIAPRPLLDLIALNDQYGGPPATHQQRVLMDLRLADVWNLTGAPEKFSFYVRGETHQFSYNSRELVYAWIDLHLQTPRAATPIVLKK